MRNVKTALVHDWLTGQRGGEKVLEVLAEIFPDAPIYTLFHVKGSQSDLLERRDIRTSFLQKAPFARTRYRFYLPLFPLAAELFDLDAYDLVVSTSHCAAKGVIPRPDSLHVSYIHSPVRYAWNQYASYFGPSRTSVFGRLLAPPVVHYLRLWDTASAARVDHFVANSANVARRIEKYYRRRSEVIRPPVDTEFFRPDDPPRKTDDLLIVSALVPYKRIDLAIAACRASGRRLKIVGTGPEEKRLRRAAGPGVEFLGAVDAGDLRRLYRDAAALVMPGEEDFGIAAVEAQACGTPVVAYGRGGALETVRPGVTGVLFPELTAASLRAALDTAAAIEFNTAALRAHAMTFSRDTFREAIAAFLADKWAAFEAGR